MDFQKRRFSKPAVRLIKTIVRTKGSYTFEAFTYEENALRQFNIHFLPNSDYYLIHFVKKKEGLTTEHHGVKQAATVLAEVFHEFRDDWTGKKSIEELTCNLLLLMIDHQQIKIPDEVLQTLQREIQRIFRNPEITKQDKLGRPYFSNAAIGKFFITDVGTIDEADFKYYNLSLQ